MNEVRPGALVTHRYAPEVGVILRVNYGMVEVLLGSGAIVKWGFDGFRSCYEVVSEDR